MQPPFVRAVLVAALTAVVLPLAFANAQDISVARLPRRNNVLLIIADDLGNDKVGVYNEGDDRTRPKTPNIDALAADGVRELTDRIIKIMERYIKKYPTQWMAFEHIWEQDKPGTQAAKERYARREAASGRT